MLNKIVEETGVSIDSPFYNNFEVYSIDDPEKVLEDKESLPIRIEYIMDIYAKLLKLSQMYVHPNHYGLLPIKTSIVSTIHSIFDGNHNDGVIIEGEIKMKLLNIMLKLCQELLDILTILVPGMTRDRGKKKIVALEFSLFYDIMKNTKNVMWWSVYLTHFLL